MRNNNNNKKSPRGRRLEVLSCVEKNMLYFAELYFAERLFFLLVARLPIKKV